MVKAKNGFYKEVFRLYIQSKRIRKAAESLQKSDLGKFMYQEPKGHCSKRSSKKTAHSHKKMEEKTAHSHKKTEKKTEKKTNKRTENKYCTKRSRTYRKVTCFCKEKHSHTSKRSCKKHSHSTKHSHKKHRSCKKHSHSTKHSHKKHRSCKKHSHSTKHSHKKHRSTQTFKRSHKKENHSSKKSGHKKKTGHLHLPNLTKHPITGKKPVKKCHHSPCFCNHPFNRFFR